MTKPYLTEFDRFEIQNETMAGAFLCVHFSFKKLFREIRRKIKPERFDFKMPNPPGPPPEYSKTELQQLANFASIGMKYELATYIIKRRRRNSI